MPSTQRYTGSESATDRVRYASLSRAPELADSGASSPSSPRQTGSCRRRRRPGRSCCSLGFRLLSRAKTRCVESPFAAVRLRTSAVKRLKRVERATAVIRETLLIPEQTSLRLDAPELLAEVAEGDTCVNGVRVTKNEEEEKAAA